MAKKKNFDTNLFVSILYVVLGLLLIIFPGDALHSRAWTGSIRPAFAAA